MEKVRNFFDQYLALSNSVITGMIGELWGTFILIVFGLGVIVQTKMAKTDFISISLGWGFAVMLGVFWSGKMGHGHINPAITIGFASVGRFSWKRVPFYCIAQLIGAFFGALCVFLIYYEKLDRMEHSNGTYTMDKTGGFFVTRPTESILTAFFDQAFGTFLLASCAIAITDKDGFDLPDHLHPLCLGLMITAIIGCFALNAGAALNPARDLGPRIMLSLCGWGGKVFSDSNYYFWVPIIAPIIGSVIGCFFYEAFIAIHSYYVAKSQEFKT